MNPLISVLLFYIFIFISFQYRFIMVHNLGYICFQSRFYNSRAWRTVEWAQRWMRTRDFVLSWAWVILIVRSSILRRLKATKIPDQSAQKRASHDRYNSCSRQNKIWHPHSTLGPFNAVPSCRIISDCRYHLERWMGSMRRYWYKYSDWLSPYR